MASGPPDPKEYKINVKHVEPPLKVIDKHPGACGDKTTPHPYWDKSCEPAKDETPLVTNSRDNTTGRE